MRNSTPERWWPVAREPLGQERETKGHLSQDLKGHWKDFGFYSGRAVKALKGFEQRGKMV